MLPSRRRRVFFREQKSMGSGCICCANLHPQVCPIDFSSAPRVGRDDVFDTITAIEKTVTTVTIVTLLKPMCA